MTINDQWPVGEPYIRDAILDYVETNLPRVHVGMRDQLGIEDDDFPIFSRIDRSGPPRGGLGGNEYALLALAVLSLNSLATGDIDQLGEPEQQVQYRVRLYSFVKAGNDQDTGPVEYGYPRAVKLRGWTEASIRSLLLTRPSLGTPNGFVRAETISAQFSDVQPVKGDRWVTGVYHEFIFQNQESTVGTEISHHGQELTFDIQTHILSRSDT